MLVISLYFLKYGNLHTKFPSEFSLYHYAQNIDIGIEFTHFLPRQQVMSSV